MAEIKIEKKKALLPWVLLGLGILALLLYLFFFKNKKEEVAGAAAVADLISVRENNSTVAAYITFIQSDTNKMSLNHKFTNEALLKLTNATDAMAEEVGYSVKVDLAKAKDYANKITNNPFETTHADDIRMSADIIATALQNIQRAKYPSLTNKVSEVQSASAAINPETLTLDQQDAVKSFFGKTANLLEKMN